MWKLEKEGGQYEKSLHLIGIKAKQKKTWERWDEVTTFCLTVNEKKTHNKEKNYRSKAPDKQQQKTKPQNGLDTVIYWNDVKKGMQVEETQRWIVRQVVVNMHAQTEALPETKPFHHTWTQFHSCSREKDNQKPTGRRQYMAAN